MRLVKLWL